jgi:hypothetical protein
MDTKKILEWGGLAVLLFVAFRVVMGWVSGMNDPVYTPGIQPAVMGGGMLSMYPVMVLPNYPNRDWRRNSGRGGRHGR